MPDIATVTALTMVPWAVESCQKSQLLIHKFVFTFIYIGDL